MLFRKYRPGCPLLVRPLDKPPSIIPQGNWHRCPKQETPPTLRNVCPGSRPNTGLLSRFAELLKLHLSWNLPQPSQEEEKLSLRYGRRGFFFFYPCESFKVKKNNGLNYLRKRSSSRMQEDKWNNLGLEQWSQPEMILFPRGYLETSRDASHSHTGEEVVAGIWGRQVGSTGKHPTRHGVGGPTTSCLVQHVNDAKFGKHWPSFEAV